MSALEAQYYSDLQDDFCQLGILAAASNIGTTADLVDVLENTYNITPSLQSRPATCMKTSLGAQVLDWCNNFSCYFSDDAPRISTCPEAEPKFIATIDSTTNGNLKSPILITNEHDVLAVAKPYGETSILSFVNNPNAGLAAFSLGSHQILNGQTRNLRSNDGVYFINIGELVGHSPFYIA